jgi:hypothetical protein
MSFLTVVVLLFAFLVAALLGIWIAFLLMRPAGRQLFRENVFLLIITLFLTSLLIFAFVFGASTLYRASAYHRVVSNQFLNSQPATLAGSLAAQHADEWKNNRSAIINEIWWQQMMPPSSTTHCYTEVQVICRLIQQVGLSIASRWNSYLIFLGLGLTGVFTFVFYSIWILKLKYDEDVTPKEILRRRPRSKARRN